MWLTYCQKRDVWLSPVVHWRAGPVYVETEIPPSWWQAVIVSFNHGTLTLTTAPPVFL